MPAAPLRITALFLLAALTACAGRECNAPADPARPVQATGAANTPSPPVGARTPAGPESDVPAADELADDAPPEELPPPPAEYMGREIAQTMHWTGAEWLMRETRETEEGSTQLLEALDVRTGQTICDLGCGNGYHTLPLARAVGNGGKVFGVDIQPQMLEMLRVRAAEAGLPNIERVLGGPADPNLPPSSCDLVIMVDVYHELAYPGRMLAAIRRALKPNGRVVLVEFRAEDPDVPIKPRHKLSKAQAQRELEANGFRLAASYDELPMQHVLFFEPRQ